MTHLSLTALLLVLGTSIRAQVPIIDYGFQAVPPSVQVNKIVEQPDGKVLVGGFFMNYAGSGKNHLVRLNSDGTVDAAWNPGGTGPQNQVRDIVLMPDGRILVAGGFVEYNGVQTQAIVRLFANGDRDYAFNIPPNSINGAVNAIDLHDGHRVIAVGDFFTCYGHSMPHIARFNDDGSLDLGFDIGTGFNGDAHCVQVLPDSRILVGGVFGMFNGNLCGQLALLTADGPYDPSMNNTPGFGGGMVLALLPQPDGKVLVGGEFQYHHMQPASCLIRLNINGTRDASFTSPVYPYARVKTIARQADGKVLIGGEFTSVMYTPPVTGPNRMVRMHPDGLRDDSFPLGEGPGPGNELTSYVSDIAVQADGKILVGGFFGNFDLETQYRNLIRLHPEASTGINERTSAPLLTVWVDPVSGELLVIDPFTAPGSVLRIHDASGRLLLERPLPNAGGAQVRTGTTLPGGIHLVSVINSGMRAQARLVGGVR